MFSLDFFFIKGKLVQKYLVILVRKNRLIMINILFKEYIRLQKKKEYQI